MRKLFVTSHLIHSRLQLIRNKLEVKKDMQPGEFVEWNCKYLDRAAKSIKNHHELNCSITEYQQAAELFLFAANENDHEILTQPMWGKKS